MNHHRRFVAWVGSGLVLALLPSGSGCSGDAGQPARESISAPRKGGGTEEVGAIAKGKPAAGKVGGKSGGKVGDKAGQL